MKIYQALANWLAVLLATGCGISTSTCLAADNIWTRGAGSLDWNVDGNWNQGGVPQAVPFEEEGIIENGDTVFIAAAVPDVAGIILGRTAGTTGGLEVRSGGTVNVIDSTGTPVGAVQVGVAGVGQVDVLPGGSLSAQSLSVNGQSTLNVGGVGGATTLNVAGAMTLNGTTRVVGSTSTINAAGVTLGGASALIAELRSTSHSPIRTSGQTILNGTFRAAFGGGFAPAVGTSWNIVDAGGISGTFDAVDVSAFPALGPGQIVRLATVPGGANGRLLQLQYRNVLTLNVDWNSKAASISSPSGQAIAIDGYSILSTSGGLNVAQWNSLQDQSLPGWAEARPAATALNELNFNVGGSLSVNATPRNLGTPFAPVIGAFGQSPEDLVFEYTSSSGETVQGLVNYTGNRIFNNLLLTVDPATGQAQLKNSSPGPLSFDGYSIVSASGSLRPANGNWSSLADQGLGPWQEANVDVTVLSELRTSDFTTLAPGALVNLGSLFNAATGTRDLELEFARQGDPGGRLGVVVYGALTSTSNADFNGNGRVDGADFLIWQRGVGISSGATLGQGDANGDGAVNGADLAIWRTRFGMTSGAPTAVPVPEPTSFAAALAAALAGCAIKRRSGELRASTPTN
jgi:hypothetical protein